MTTKQVKFLDKNSQEILGGILIDDETLICGCCGGVFDKDEWEDDKANIEEGYVFAYVENVDNPWCSEFGSIAVKSQFGGLVRIG